MARAPMPAPQMIETPAMRRSAALAKALEDLRAPPQQIGGYGDLGARLLAQGITQWSKGRADKAVEGEKTAADDAIRARLAAVLDRRQPPADVAPAIPMAAALTNTQEPQQAQTAPVPPVMGSAMPPVGQPVPMADVPPMPQAPAMPAPQAPPQAAPQGQIPPALASHIRQLADSGDLQGAQAMLNNYQSQQAMMEMLPPEIRNDPVMAWLAATNPDEFTKAVSQQYSPQVVAEGGAQRIAGTDETFRNARTFVAGGDIMQTAPNGVTDVGDVSPTYGDRTARMVAERPIPVNTAPGATTSFMDVGGQITGQIQGAETPETVARREDASRAEAQSRARALQVIGNTTDAIARARAQTGNLSAGVLSGLIPMNQWRANLAGTIETIQANLSFTELAQMRAASPTGGALGSIAVRELELLGATVASLNQNQSPEEFRRSLDVIDGAMARWKEAVEASSSEAGAASQASPQVAYDAQGRRFVVRNGQWVPE